MLKNKAVVLMLSTALAVSATTSLTSQAIYQQTNSPEQEFEDCIKLEGDTSWFSGAYLTYVYRYDSGAATMYKIDAPHDIIHFSTENDNIDEICEKIKSIDSRLYISANKKDGLIGSRDKRISRETAQKLYELIEDDITKFNYEFDIYSYQTVAYKNITGYRNTSSNTAFDDYRQIIEDYVLSNNIDAAVTGDEKNIEVIPNEALTLEEHFELAKNIYDLTGLLPYGISPAGDTNPIKNSLEMKDNVKGDANGDEKVTIADSTAILQALGNADKYALSIQGEYNADVYGNGDGVTAMDAIAIQEYEAKIIDSF